MNEHPLTSAILSSTDGGYERLTITTNTAQGSDIDCAAAYVRPHGDNTGRLGMLISNTEQAGPGNFIEITEVTTPMSLYIANLSLLSFYGTVNGDKVEILYRK